MEVDIMAPKVAPYGSWKSPITSDLMAAGAMRLMGIALDGDDVYWLESRPLEGGRYVIVRQSVAGDAFDINPPPSNARTRVHEYGGAPFAVHQGVVYFSNFADQRLYRQEPGGEPTPITPEEDLRYADAVIDRARGRLICVCEDHTVSDREAVNTIAGLRLGGNGPAQVLVSGNDFYSSPRLSADGSRLAWLTWSHPNMPWDGTELWVAAVRDDGSLGGAQRVAGGESESIFHPQWSEDGTLYFVSDRTDWWNLYRWNGQQVQPLCTKEAEFGLPQWVFGMSTYAIESNERIVCAYTSQGSWKLAMVDTRSGDLATVDTPYSHIFGMRARRGEAFFVAGSPTSAPAVVRWPVGSSEFDVLRSSSHMEVDEGYLSVAQAIEFPTEGGLTAHALYYPPKNRDLVAPEGELPPLLVISHGGPTGSTSDVLNWGIQYWTSRGVAVVDVNYGGSTGYGRPYRERLKGQWGVVDVDDCANAALYLAGKGWVDAERMAIRGGSAGGYTTLSALAFRDVFHAGASFFGVSDLEALTVETHKFESRYLDSLVGPYPEAREVYLERSPIHHVERLSNPMILFQGLEDKVVPPNQAEMMVEALRNKGVPVAYVPFEGEQHGFRRAKNIKRALEAEQYFYSRIFGFDLAEDVEPVTIENLD
jgi:dipeptidyl aminopeptidase/acylaminoacyl peptidase